MTILQEKGLSRLYTSILQHDCGTITAFRDSYSLTDNKRRNVSLLARLHDKGFSVTAIQGGYIENYNTPEAKKVNESSFFVVDNKDLGTLRKVITTFGHDFEQDSIMFIPKGGQQAVLIGTSPYKAWPGLGNEEVYTNKVFGDRSAATKSHDKKSIKTPPTY